MHQVQSTPPAASDRENILKTAFSRNQAYPVLFARLACFFGIIDCTGMRFH
jgi:hypothetical protein